MQNNGDIKIPSFRDLDLISLHFTALPQTVFKFIITYTRIPAVIVTTFLSIGTSCAQPHNSDR